jgi:chloramphenicol 3-O-phosphotransferase
MGADCSIDTSEVPPDEAAARIHRYVTGGATGSALS